MEEGRKGIVQQTEHRKTFFQLELPASSDWNLEQS